MQEKRLVRSTNDRMIGGVCGGLADYFGIDPVLIRLAFVVGEILTSGAGGIIVYIVLWIIMPPAVQPAAQSVADASAAR
nr:PspC domain-containing protein [Anaerolineae bacterium]